MGSESDTVKQPVRKLLHLLVVFSVPVLLSAGIIRLLLTPVFTQVEYQLPGFPTDPYGFSRQERLDYAGSARQYLVRNQDLDTLEILTFADGSRLFNARELSHLRDVKIVLRGLFRTAYAGVLVVLGAAVWSGKLDDWGTFVKAVSRGGWLTVGLVVLIIILSVLDFQSFFFKFHRVFFEGNTWLFYNSDTLIRLFPLRFWRDAFLLFGVLNLAGGLVLSRLPGWLDFPGDR
jgi:integral membrane protein (TIGR01906 family)